MADNVTLPGTGNTVASEDLGGVQYQLVKPVWGPAGVANPISDTTPLPVINADCLTLLSDTLTVAGVTASMDTYGYGAVVAQLTGVWQGSGYFEASNNNVDWDMILVFSRDNLSLQDNVTSGGLYTIRPSGRYLRFRLTSIVGSMGINALGRSVEGISAGDLLSLAMDKSNNAPLHTELSDSSLKTLNTPKMDLLGKYNGFGAIPIGQLMIIDCTGYATLSIHSQVGTTGVIGLRWSNDGTTFSANALTHDSGAGTSGPTMNAGMRLGTTAVMARYAQLYMATATTGTLPTFLYVYGSTTPVALPSVNNIASVTSVSAIGTLNSIIGNAATNSTTVATMVSAATNNLTQIKGTLGRIFSLHAANTTATIQYLKLFALPSASVTMGTTNPVQNIMIPANSVRDLNINDLGLCLGGTGISFAITTGAALLDNTATTAGAVLLNYAFT